jgi:hypothetical protein
MPDRRSRGRRAGRGQPGTDGAGRFLLTETAEASFPRMCCLSSGDPGVAADYGSRIAQCHEEPVRRGPGRGLGAGGTASTISAACAIAGGISAAHATVAPERTYGKEKAYGSIP